MDLGGGSSAIENAASNQSTKQTPVGAVVSTAMPVQTQSFTALMQQAVAMQQYHFQQALMMQQAIAAQQVVSQAPSIKTAAEMAAARAAEISKQLTREDAERDKSAGESKSRSRSKSASHSVSASRSKSRSRSPIHYKRRRSVSRSPIRYQRDYYSPSRVRDYNSYRRRYRGYYYRGRGDYSWSLYRRERDRDHFYRSSRRSRSKVRIRSRSRSRSPRWSRSKGRRTRTLSRSPRRRRRSYSPRFYKGKSVSPKHKHEERKSYRSSNKSAPVEALRSPSLSSRSMTSSLVGNRERSSPSNAIEDTCNALAKGDSPVKVKGKEIGSGSSIDHLEGTCSSMKQELIGVCGRSRDSISIEKAEMLRSPARSLSVSFEHDALNERMVSDDEVLEGRQSQNYYNDDMDFYDEKHNTDQVGLLTSKDASEKGHNCDMSDVEKDSSGQEVGRGKLASVSKTLLGDGSEDNERLGDWHDDLRGFLREKGNGNAIYGRRGPESDVEQIGRSEALKTSIGYAVERCLEEDDHTSSEHELHCCLSKEMKLKGQVAPAKISGGYSTVGEGRHDQGYGEYYGQGLLGRANLEADTDLNNEDTNMNARNVENGKGGEEEVVFEGPRPASEYSKEVVSKAGFARGDSEVNEREVEDISGRTKPEKRHRRPPDYQRSSDSKALSGSVEDLYSGREGAECILTRAQLKLKDSRRHEDGVDKREKRKHRHRKHRHKRRYENSDQEREDTCHERQDDGEGHKLWKRHRRHKKDVDHDHRYRKRQKDRYRVRSPSRPLEGSFLDNVDGVKREDDLNATRKKGLKRQRKSKRDLPSSLC